MAPYPLSPVIIVKEQPQFGKDSSSNLYEKALTTVQRSRLDSSDLRSPQPSPQSPTESLPSTGSQSPTQEEVFSFASATEYLPDDRFQSTKVNSLNQFNFDNYLEEKEKALVFFYNEFRQQYHDVEREFSKAADKNTKRNYGYASVECFKEKDLCAREWARKLPMFKLYSNGFEVSSMRYVHDFNADQMGLFMKMTPIMTKPREEMAEQALAKQSKKCSKPKICKFFCRK